MLWTFFSFIKYYFSVSNIRIYLEENNILEKDKIQQIVKKKISTIQNENKKQTVLQQMESDIRQFETSIDIDNEVINAYEQGQVTIQHMLEDDLVAKGYKEIEKYRKPMSLAVAMYASSFLVSNIKSEMDKIVKTTQETVKLVEQGKLSVKDLSTDKEFREKLKELNLSKLYINQMIHYRKDAYDLMITQVSLIELNMTNNFLQENQREYLHSEKFFDIRKRETHELLSLYFKNSKNEIFHKINVMNLSIKDSRRLEKSAEKNGFSASDISAIRVARKLGNLKRARIALVATKTKSYLRIFYDLSGHMKDDLTDEGLQTLSVSQKISFASYSVVKAGIISGRVSVHFFNKIPGIKWIESKAIASGKFAGKKVVRGIKYVGTIISTPIQTTKKVVKRTVVNKIEKSISDKTITDIRKVQTNARENGKKVIVKAKKTAISIKEGTETVERTVRTVITPFRLIGGILNFVMDYFNKIKIKIAIGWIAVLALYIFFIAIMSMLIAVGNSSGERIATTIISKDTNLVVSMVNTLEEKLKSREIEAISLTETVKNPRVLGERTIDRYGCQKVDGTWTNGYKITYVDRNGVEIVSGANNSKDVIILTYLLMQGDFDSDEVARDKLLIDMWNLMNSDYNYQETDIYTCSKGCETVYYCCNDETVLSETGYNYETASDMQRYIEESVFFKDGIQINLCEDVCNGHSIEACFGHKDIQVNVTTVFMEDMFETNELLSSSTGANYGSYWTKLSKFKSNPEAWNNGWTESYIAWGNNLYNQNWIDLYGIDTLGSISTCAKFTEYEIMEILAENGLTDRSDSLYRVCYYALSKVGYPYSQSLRDSGTAYDCSSLCYYAWKYAGKNLTYEGSNTAAQEAKGLVNNGIIVYDSTEHDAVYNQANLKAGDLIFYSYEKNGRYLNISHVAIYIGNGMVVEARGSAYGVVYRKVPSISKIVLVARVRD